MHGPEGAPTTGKRRILVSDGSRLVRATLAKRLQERFDIVEESNGESAWQRLMLDGSIVAVISGLQPPRLSARAFLERIRSSALGRLRRTPFFLIVSDLDHNNLGTEEWRDGVGFLTKSMDTKAMLDCLESQLSPPAAAVGEKGESRLAPTPPAGNARGLAAAAKAANGAANPTQPVRTGKPAATVRGAGAPKLMSTEAFGAAVDVLDHPADSGSDLCMLVFGIDRMPALLARFGPDVAELLISRLAKLLAAKIDPNDQLGRYGSNHVAIISYGVDLPTGVRFAQRVCRSLVAGQISICGQKIRLTVSAGLAAASNDQAASARELLELADKRLLQAMKCGGNAACTELRPDCPVGEHESSDLKALRRVLRGSVDGVDERRRLGLAVLPLLRTLDARLALRLPLADLARRLGGDDEEEFSDFTGVTTSEIIAVNEAEDSPHEPASI